MGTEEELLSLYYPYATPLNINNMKKTLLIFNRIYFILPTEEDAYHGLGIERAPSDGFTEMHIVMQEYIDKGIFRIIRPADTVREYGEFMLPALEEDQKDPQFMEQRNNPAWLIYPEKIPYLMDDIIKQVGQRERNVIRLPFVQGESIMISHAVYACHSKQKEGISMCPITDNPVHRKLLVRRLNRGVENVKSKQQEYEIPKIKNAIDMYIPEPTVSVEKILETRRTHEKPLNHIRANIKRLADIMQNPDDPQYEVKVRMIGDEIHTAYNELGFTNTPKDIVKSRRNVPDDYNPYRPEVIGAGGIAAFGVGISTIPNIAHGMISAHETSLSRDVSSEMALLPKTSIDLQLAV